MNDLANLPEQGTVVKSMNETIMLVTVFMGTQRLGIPVLQVQDVLTDMRISPIPQAPKDIAGSINLRGRIVTVIDLWEKMGHPTDHCNISPTLVVLKSAIDPCSLLVDKVSEVMEVSTSQIEKAPSNLPQIWREHASGVCQLQDELMVVVDVPALLKAGASETASTTAS